MTELENLGVAGKKAAVFLNTADTEYKNKILMCIADSLCENALAITQANKKDLAMAEANGVSKAMQDRLLFDEKRILKESEMILTKAPLWRCFLSYFSAFRAC